MSHPNARSTPDPGADAKPFLYLVQGKGPLPDHYADLVSPRSDLIQLAWGEPVDGAIHLPGSTWTEGRNRLLQDALARPEPPLYYIFLDDDVVFEKGDWRLFEDELLTHRPAIAAPHYPQYGVNHPAAFVPISGVRVQTLFWFDAIYSAFHRDVVEDGVLLPYHTGLDSSSWVYSQWFVIMLARLLYPRQVVQINKVWITNNAHNTDYEISGEIDFSQPLSVLRTAVRSHSPLFVRIVDRIRHSVGLTGREFVSRPAPAPRQSYRLPERARRIWIRRTSPFWSDRRAAPLASDSQAT